ncbi:unnamed protein product [Eruca vesicaria subsp. sativa]|uniref:X8 domain-containing protein n=1 Tax=Eruca vesicaria subsp. sativa TaxID=29727 RepID=A0ABC8JCT5_ERUVS|nr:unnamed protein product [Eruca vesicaria subsp. sativa]
MLQAALDWACGPGKVDCSALMQGEECYEPDDVKMMKASGSCDFKGVSTVTFTDPSRGTCVFPGSAKSNQTLGHNTTELAPSANSTTSGCFPHPQASFVNLTFLSLILLFALVFL